MTFEDPETEAGSEEEPFLYLTTTGWKSGRPHQIEIWFTRLDGRYYVIAETRERAHWVQNLVHRPQVEVRVARTTFTGMARTLDPRREGDLSARVAALSQRKYGWGDGLIVEILPD
jgi:deazaflavin-dependent oxidoreductase (nitroreductase family)